MPNIKDTLIAARELIADPEHWAQGAYAIDNTANEVYPDEPNAYAFCGAGAVMKASDAWSDHSGKMHTTEHYVACIAALAHATRRIFGPYSVTSINDGEISDDPEQAHRDILRVFDQAIADA